MTDKGPGEAPSYGPSDTKDLRIGIVHARWNAPIISALVAGATQALTEAGVPPSNITTQTCPGSYELPLAAQRMLAASQTTTSGALVSAATDLLGGSGGSATDLPAAAGGDGAKGPGGAFDAVIAIGVLIKGSTMHFEYIADAVSHGLMRVQLDAGVPVVFGVLTCLSEEQARTRAGLGEAKAPAGEKVHYAEQGHNHGVDWGKAAVEMSVKKRAWGEGRFV